MRTSIASALLALACALMIGPTFAADEGARDAKSTGAASGVSLSGAGAVPAEPGKPALALSPENQQIVRDAVTRLDTHQPTPKEFQPALGVDVPRAVYIHALPQSVIDAIPALKEYMYAHLDREVVIVDALGMKAAMVIPLPEDSWASKQASGTHEAAVNAIGGLGGLSEAQLRMIYQSVVDAGPASQAGASGEAASSSSQTTGQNTASTEVTANTDVQVQPAPNGVALIAGTDIPPDLTLSPLPAGIGEQTPQVQGLAFARLQDGRLLLADPHTRKMVGVITQEDGTDRSAVREPGSRDPLRHLEDSGNANAYTGPHTIR